MIKIAFRKNHIYLVFAFISYFIRRIISILLSKIFGLSTSLLFCHLMCLGQIIGGSSIYFYQKSFLDKKGKYTHKRIIYKLTRRERTLKKADNVHKIRLLIFFASFFDLEEYFITTYFIPKIAKLSTTASFRLSCIMTIMSSLLCFSSFKYKIGKHQILSLIILSIIFLITYSLEFVYKPDKVNLSNYIVSYVLLFFHFLFRSFTDVTEKYLGDYDYMNPFQIITTEGIISFVFITIYSFFDNPFKEVGDIYTNISKGEFVLLIFLLFLYFVLCGFVNVYKIICNLLYSPMAKSLASYFLNSAFIIYHYSLGNDFLVEGEKNILYFLISIIFSILVDFFTLIYNEFIILNFWGLSVETHPEIADRSSSSELQVISKNLTKDSFDYSEDDLSRI